MFRLITYNLGIKIFCLFVSVGLWIYVAAGQDTVGKFPSSIKIKAINTPAGLVAVYNTKTVNVRIMAEPSVWKKLSGDSFSAYVDLSSYAAGTYEVPVSVVSSVAGVQVVERDPDKTMISLEPISDKVVKINRKIEGSAGDGLVAGGIDISPDEVKVRGAKSIIDDITEATVVITLNGESENFKKVLPVVAYDEKGELIQGIEFSPAEVNTDVAIVKASNNRTMGIKVKTAGLPKTGYYVSSVSSSPSVVDITGVQSITADINYIETFAVDMTGATDDIDRDVNLNVPSGVSLQPGSPEMVHVKIVIAPSEVSREVVVPVKFDGLDAALKITDINPSQLRAVLSGTTDLISNLKVADCSLSLDLKGKSAGIYSFDVSADNFKLPKGVSLVTSLPSAISVTVEHR